MGHGKPAAAGTPLRRHWWALAPIAAAAVLASLGNPATFAADASPKEVSEKQSDLKSLRSQIDSLRRELATAEASRRDGLDQLKGAEQAISSTQRELHELTAQTARLQTRLQDVGQQSHELAQRLEAQQLQLGKLLYRQYLRGNPDPLRLLLNGDDPNQLARDLYYFEAIGRARRQLLLEIESTLHQKQALAAETRQQAEQLAALEVRQSEEHARLLTQRAERRATLDKLSEQIASQRHAIGSLQRDEKLLTNLIDRLAKIIAARAAEARQAQRRELARQEQHPDPLAPADPVAPADPLPPGGEPGVSIAPQPPQPPRPPQVPGAGFAARKGGLHLPTRGAVANRFGSARQEGSTWKGLFIRAKAGTEVHSIAGGRVVFAEWMRGFGNLLIVDHGESYLSIYANNDSVLKQVGDEVKSGEAIATVGNTGGNPESGLYFELRHQGKPLDPLAWVNLQ